jgi:hypothetical protein
MFNTLKRTVQHNNPEDSHLYTRRRENLEISPAASSVVLLACLSRQRNVFLESTQPTHMHVILAAAFDIFQLPLLKFSDLPSVAL